MSRAAQILAGITSRRSAAQRRSNYAPRRVPHSFPPGYLRRRLLPLAPPALLATTLSGISGLPLIPKGRRTPIRGVADRLATDVSERAQRLYFDEPGLDTLTVRAIGTWAQRLANIGRLYLRTRIALGWDADGRAATMLPLVPRRGYDTLMVSMLVIGTALGYFKGGPVHIARFYDDSLTPARLPLPDGQPIPQPRRLHAPRSLGDMCADIDDLYWAEGAGQTLKITRVGEGEKRRWLISMPGTESVDPISNANPADTEANIREVLNLPSSMRGGLLKALHDAMARDGIAPEDVVREPVMICGHSQGGMVGTALATAPPETLGINVKALLTLGTPSRRLRIRDDVTMIAVAHDQDIVPSIDGTSARVPDHRVSVGRRLVRPRKGPLYYAHASVTYTETVHHMERKVAIAPWGRLPEAVARLREFLPSEDEPTRVFFYEVWQDVLEPTHEHTWCTVVSLEDSQWQPVEHRIEWEPSPLMPLNYEDLRRWWTRNDAETNT
ncbi:alpha/beta hydrolase [Schaalia sp. Marseille-Q2122]|uniref:alpha/beta hydrolase n=1 Tax=Schaalia sp. Marseille-Q2122 TaxID=2736604 RepID=UPI001588FE0F|nr:alpha/beta hydrolase [Schaalia sp. Marseille-Q2122]